MRTYSHEGVTDSTHHRPARENRNNHYLFPSKQHLRILYVLWSKACVYSMQVSVDISEAREFQINKSFIEETISKAGQM